MNSDTSREGNAARHDEPVDGPTAARASDVDDSITPAVHASASRVVAAGTALAQMHLRICDLVAVRAGRGWTPAEHDEYVTLVLAEARSRRSYLSARHGFDAARRRSWAQRERVEDGSGGDDPSPAIREDPAVAD